MKYVVVVFDGAADDKVAVLDQQTPFEAAEKPMLDRLVKTATVGTVSNVPDGMVPESDTANLAILSYDPKVYSKGRSPLEAVSMGLELAPDETAFRCNVVTLSDSGMDDTYETKMMVDHGADEISTAEADQLIRALEAAFGNEDRHFYTGVSYRHCLIWKNAPAFTREFMRPHDILGQNIRDYLPEEPYLSLMAESAPLLSEHPVNIARMEKGLRPANSIWLWSPGKKPQLPSFAEKWGLQGTVISAVDLIKGIGKCAGMDVPDITGATGNIHTNFEGKAQAAIHALQSGRDFVFIHVEAPDECGHRGEPENKVRSIEYIDARILTPVVEYLEESGEPFKIMVLPDHPTPLSKRTHSIDPVPFMIYDSENPVQGVESFTEENARDTGLYIERGEELLTHMIGAPRITE